jgi:hypothetical protein
MACLGVLTRTLFREYKNKTVAETVQIFGIKEVMNEIQKIGQDWSSGF